MSISFRNGFYGGATIALITGLALLWLWQPERQVRKHTESLFRSIEGKKWERVADLVASDYEDQWGHDRPRMLGRLREVFRYFRQVHLSAVSETIQVDLRSAVWKSRVTVETDSGELGALLKDRVNSVATPFELQWRRGSAKPWDWKLVRVSNPGLEVPADAY